MYMDDIKLFVKNKKELKTLIQTVRIYNQDIKMEFDIEKCTMQVMKSGKRHMTEGFELPNQKKKNSKRSEKRKPTNTWEYWKLTPSNKWKWKKKFKKQYLRRTRKVLETKLNSSNLVKGINTWAVVLVRYSGLFLKWVREELKQMDQRTRKLMAMNKALHPKNDVNRLYVSRREGREYLPALKTALTLRYNASDYIQKRGGRLITATRNNTDDTGSAERKLSENKSGKKNNSVDVLSD